MIREYLFEVDPYDDLDLRGHVYNAMSFNMPYSVLDSVKEIKPRLILEVGSWRGASAIYMANQAKSKNIDTEIICIDTWLGAREMWTKPDRFDYNRYTGLKLKNGYPSVYLDFLKNVFIAGHRRRITPFPATSITAARILEHINVMADFIYIDGSHDYEDVKMDIEAYWKVLEPGGVMLGDDYTPDYWGVKPAVDEFADKYGLSLGVWAKDNGWMLRKPQAEIQ